MPAFLRRLFGSRPDEPDQARVNDRLAAFTEASDEPGRPEAMPSTWDRQEIQEEELNAFTGGGTSSGEYTRTRRTRRPPRPAVPSPLTPPEG